MRIGLIIIAYLYIDRCSASAATSISRRIYRTVASHQMGYCIQIATATSRRTIGCRSKFGGNMGPVEWLSPGDTAGAGSIGFTELSVFVNQWRKNFTEDWRKLNGLVVVISDTDAVHHARLNLTEIESCAENANETTETCINGLSGVAAHYTIPFPVVLLKESVLKQLENEHENITDYKLAKQKRLWAALTFSYSGISNSHSCLARQKRLYHSSFIDVHLTQELHHRAKSICEPLSETALAWTVAEKPRSLKRQDKSLLLVVTRLDSFSVFTNWQSGITLLHASLAVMLAFARAMNIWALNLNESERAAWSDRDVVLLFLTGESYGHLASRYVAKQLRSDSQGLLGAIGQPAALFAQNVHSVIEVGPLGFANKERPFAFIGVGEKGVLDSHRSSGVAVSAGGSFPSWSSLSVLKPAVGLLLTDRHGAHSGPYPNWNSVTDVVNMADPEQLAKAANKLIRLAVHFLLSGSSKHQSDASVNKAAVNITSWVRLAADCLNFTAGHLCSDLTEAYVSGSGGDLARSLERWRLAGLDAGFGGGRAIRAGAGPVEPSSVRLLASTLLMRYTMRPDHSNRGCSNPPEEESGVTRGLWFDYKSGYQKCQLSSLTSVSVNPDTEFGWVMSAQDAFPTLHLFARQSVFFEVVPFVGGIILTLLWAHLTANAIIYLQASPVARCVC